MGIDVQIIAPPPPQCYYTVPLDIAVKATQMVNDGIAAFCAQKADRLKPLGSVPMIDGGEAAKELERCVKKLGFSGVEVLTNVAGKELSDPGFAPFWKKAEELGALVMIHAENFECLTWLTERLEAAGKTEPKYHATSRPMAVEREIYQESKRGPRHAGERDVMQGPALRLPVPGRVLGVEPGLDRMPLSGRWFSIQALTVGHREL